MKPILVIDDDEDILEIFNIIFRDAGYNVVISNHSETAAQIDEIGPDLVILVFELLVLTRTGAALPGDQGKIQGRSDTGGTDLR